MWNTPNFSSKFYESDYPNKKLEDNFWKMTTLCRISKVISIIILILFWIGIISNIVSSSILQSALTWNISSSSMVFLSIITFAFISSDHCFKQSKQYTNRQFGISEEDIEFPQKRILFGFLAIEVFLIPLTILMLVLIIFSFFNLDLLLFPSWKGSTIGALIIALTICLYFALLIARVCIWIAGGILIKSCKILEKDWNANPPELAIIEKKKLKQELKEKQDNDNLAKTIKLLEKCGMRFFIKYFNQIRRLSVRDILIEEEYTQQEKEERIQAVKQIIDNKLIDVAINEILNNYSDVLSPKEIEAAQKIKVNYKEQ